MAQFNYARMAATADRLMQKVAQGVCTLTRSTPGTPDPETPWIPGTPTTEVFTLSATASGVSQEFINGTTILATDLMLTISPKMTGTAGEVDTDIRSADVLAIDGKGVSVIKTMRLPSAGTLVAWRVIARG